ncbi:MAG: hypothetical protein AAB587_01135 [Patescibacteria group bacterium]
MRDTQRGFIIPLVVGLIAVVLGGGIYFYMRSQDAEGNLKRELARAQKQVIIEKEKLKNLENEFEGQYPLYLIIREQYAKAREAIDYSDVFFTNPNTSSLQIKIKTKTSAVETKVEAQRTEVNKALNAWKDLIALPNANNVTVATINSILESAETMESFIAQLSAIVDGLTPANSGLTLAQIDAYQALIDSLSGNIGSVVESLTSTQSTSQNTGSQSSTTGNTVTVQDIQVQQTVVAQAQAEVQAISQGGTSSQEPQASLSPEDTPLSSDPDFIGVSPSSDPLIITPGIPQLIQGTNNN